MAGQGEDRGTAWRGAAGRGAAWRVQGAAGRGRARQGKGGRVDSLHPALIITDKDRGWALQGRAGRGVPGSAVRGHGKAREAGGTLDSPALIINYKESV